MTKDTKPRKNKTRSISLPIKKLIKTMQMIAAGDMSQRVSVTSNDEIGVLSKTFNTMITKLEVVDKSKSEFISLASHQLRTPLTSMKLFIELIKDTGIEKFTDEQRKYINVIGESVERMELLVKDLLNISRIEAEQLEIKPTPTQIEDIIDDLINEAKPIAEAKGGSIVFERPKEKLSKISVDPVLLWQIIDNFISNAIQYTSDEGGSIIVGLREAKDEYVISVKDNGIGIPKDAQPRIFEKFFRADNAIKKVTDNSGLGLYVAKMVIDKVGGRIWFESEENKGSTFYVAIPKAGMKAN